LLHAAAGFGPITMKTTQSL